MQACRVRKQIGSQLASRSSWRDSTPTGVAGGERTWRSAEREVHLAVTHDKTNTVLVWVTLENGAPPRWKCESELELDPGAFRSLARAARDACA